MAIKPSRYYNNAGLGQAFENIAGMFAPPSGSDLAGYASAAARKEEAARRADLFNYARDPNFDQTTFDRLGVGAGVYSPNQSYYAVDQSAATARRGQDVSAATSRANNAADNQRATITSMYTPLNPGQIRPEVPEHIAATVGLPVLPQTAGAEKPLSESEMKAAILRGLPEADQNAAVLGDIPVERVVTPEGARFVRRNDAVGQQPFVNRGSEAKPLNYSTPDGRRGTATVSEGGRLVDTQTGEALPQGTVTYGTNVQGSQSDVGLAPTVANTTSANNQEAEITRALNLLDVYENTIQSNPGAIGFAGLIRGTAQNAVATANDLANSFGKSAPEVIDAARSVREGLQAIAPQYFDASIPEAEFLQGTLAYSLARTENPSGEVSRQAFDRALDRVRGGGLLANSQSALAAIGANRKVLQSQLDGLNVLRNPGTGRTDVAPRQPNGATTPTAIPPAAADMLRNNPALADQFDAKYGAGAAASILGGAN